MTHTHTHTCTRSHTQHTVCVYTSPPLHCIQTHCLPLCSCAIYDGSLCNSVFGRANITVPPSITNISAFIAAQDISIGTTMEQFSPVVDQDCLDYGLFIACVGLYLPCPGSAWCGANSRDELRSAVSSACRCDRANSCVVNINGVNITAEDTLLTIINTSLPNYYVGSSSTGPVGDSNAVCQDVTGKRHNLHACSLHCVVVELVGSVLCGGVSDIFSDFTLFGHS